jgi:hypothetical protein
VTLPVSDIVSALNELCDKIEDNTATVQLIVDELVRMNEDKQAKMEEDVRTIRDALDRQYRETIENLEKRLPNHGHTFPFINGPIGRGGGIGEPPANPEPL